MAPFVAAMLLGFVTLLLPGQQRIRMESLWAAGAVFVLLLVAVAAVPWRRLPDWTQASIPLAFFSVIALLRDAAGGSSSGLSALVILPVLWLALHGTRGQLYLGVAGAGAVFLVPILMVGAPDYPSQDWARVLLWPPLAGIVGHAVSQLVQRQRARAVRLETDQIFIQSVLDNIDVGIVACDATGHLTLFNQATRQMHGVDADETTPMDEWGNRYDLFAADGQTPLTTRDIPLVQALDGQHVHDQEIVIAPTDGSAHRVLSRAVQMTRADGTLMGAVAAMHDITARRDAEQAVRDSEERLRLLIDATSDYAIFMLDPHGIIQTWNTGAQRITGYTAEEITGQHFSVFYPADRVDEGHPAFELKQAARSGRYAEEGWRVRKDGTTFWSSVTISAIRDDTGRLRGFSKITRDLTEVRAAERIKEQFLAVVSHELRTPLTSIIGFLEMLLEEPDLTVHQVRFLTTIDRNAHRLLRLVGDLLLTAQIEAGSVTLDLSTVNVSALAQAAVEAAEPRAHGTNVALTLHDDGTPPVYGDAGRLGQMLDNLLSNAIKFTPAGGQVHLTVSTIPGAATVVVEVTDTGIGIPLDEQGLLFERFFRASTATSRAIPGIGLGLTIVKTIVEAHHGQLSMTSTEGTGTTFHIELPTRRAGQEESGSAQTDATSRSGDPMHSSEHPA